MEFDVAESLGWAEQSGAADSDCFDFFSAVWRWQARH
jgi:hypothetical protein